MRVVAIVAAFTLVPFWCRAADRDLVDLTRDVLGLQDQISKLQTSADLQTHKLEESIQELAKTIAKMNNSMEAVQSAAGRQLSPEQTGATAIASLNAQLDTMRNAAGSLRASFADINNRMGSVQQRLADVTNALAALGSPQAAAAAGATIQAPSTPSGVSAETLYQNAQRDKSSGNYSLALAEFADYLKYFPTTEAAARAQFEMGQIYYAQKQYAQALQAFSQVTAKYPESDRAADAYYMQGMTFVNLDQRQQAADAFRHVAQKFPNSNAAAQAKLQLQNLDQGK